MLSSQDHTGLLMQQPLICAERIQTEFCYKFPHPFCILWTRNFQLCLWSSFMQVEQLWQPINLLLPQHHRENQEAAYQQVMILWWVRKLMVTLLEYVISLLYMQTLWTSAYIKLSYNDHASQSNHEGHSLGHGEALRTVTLEVVLCILMLHLALWVMHSS